MACSSRIFDEPLTWAGKPSIETISAFSCKLIDFKHREDVSGESGRGRYLWRGGVETRGMKRAERAT